MFHNQLFRYLSLPSSSKQPELFVDTKSLYEFTMIAIRIDGVWYALVESPDLSRVNDIDEIIDEEFGADVMGWCVLKDHQKKLGVTIPFHQGEAMYDAITYKEPPVFYWLLRIEPRQGSRLG